MSTYRANVTKRLNGLASAVSQLQQLERAIQLNDTLVNRRLEKLEEHLENSGKQFEERLKKIKERMENDSKRIDHMVAGVNDTNKIFRNVLIRIARRPSRSNTGQSLKEGSDTYVVGGDMEDS